MNRSRPDENSTSHELAELRCQNAELNAVIEKMTAEQKRYIQNLQLCEQKHSLLFEKSAFPATLSKLPEGIIVEVNEAFEREFGISKREAVGKTTWQLGINPDVEGRKRIIETLGKSGFVRNQEMVLHSKSGEKRFYETNIEKVVINGEEYLLNTTQNISEYKFAENKLKENYDLIRIAGEKAKLGGWNVILNENRCYWSDEVAAIHEMPAGYAPLVEDGINFYAPEWRDKITEVFTLCATQGIPYDEELEILTATGKRVWVRTIGEAVRDENGAIFKIQGAFQDITVKKQAEKELKDSETRYRAIFESTGTATLIVDWDATILMANTECFNSTGYTPSELIGRKWIDYVAPESLSKMIKNHNLRRESPELAPKKYEVKLLNSKGEKRDVVLNVNMIPGTNHSVVSMLDITGLKMAQEELEKNRNNLEEYFENDISADYVVSVAGEIFSCNKTFLNLFGFEKKSETERFDITELYKNPKDRKNILRLIKKQGKVENHEVEFVSKTGNSIYALVNAIGIFDEDNKLEKIRGYVVDITEQKNIEKELVKFKLCIERSSEAIFITDVEGHIIFVNPAFEQLYGYTSDECNGKTPRILKSGTYEEDTYKKFWSTLLSKNAVSGEIVNKTKKGSLITMDVYNRSILDSNGKIYGFIGIHKDITERKKIEEELKKSEEKYRRFFEDDLTGNYHTTPDGEILTCNDAFVKMLKYKNKEEIYAINTSELYFSNADRDEFIKKLKTEKKLQNNKRTLKARDGSEVEIIENVVGVFDDSGELKEVIGYMWDITEQKKAQFEYQTMITTSRDGFWIVDAPTGKFIEVNQSYCEIIGYSREELLQMTIQDIEAVESHEEIRQHIELIVEKGFDSFETKHKTKSGKIIDIDASVTFYGSGINKFFVFVKEITERKRTEIELQKLSRAVEQSPASIIITDLNGDIEYVNPKTLEITGYTKEELVGKNTRMFNSGEKPKEEYLQLWSTIKSGNIWAGEFHNKKKNGELYWESVSISPVLNEKQEIVNYIGVKEDITERKRFDETRKLLLEISQLTTKHVTLNSLLAEVHQKIKKLTRADNFYVALHNEKDNTFTFPYHVDEYDKVELDKAYDFRGGFTDYVIQSNQSLIITPEYQPEIEKNRKVKGYGSERSVWLGVPFKTKKGDMPNGVIAIQDYKNLESYSETDKIIMEIIAHSIGGFIERIKYVEELLQSKEKAEANQLLFETIFDNAPIGIALFDGQSGKFLKINKSYCELLGYLKNELIGLDFMHISYPEDLPNDLANMEKLRNGEINHFEMEKRLYSKNGQVIHTKLTVVPLGFSMWQTDTHLSIVQDITNDKKMIARLEENNIELLKAKEKAEESDRLKSAFLTNMSHEIRTPMNGILGFTDLLLDPGLSSEEKESYIKIVHKSGQRMLNTVNDIIEISKIEAGLVELRYEVTDFNKKVEELFQFFTPEANRKGLKIILKKLLPEEKKYLFTDQNKLYSILTNLIKNAIKYTKAGTITIGCQFKEPVIEFHINDTGIGIPRHRQEAIFNRFEQADIEDTRVFEGSGLGLAIAKSYVEMLGGNIWVESEEANLSAGKTGGSTFYFTLPATNKTDEKPIHADKISSDNNSAKSKTKELKIIIAEDDEASRTYLSVLINDFSKEILFAETGSKCVELCRGNTDIDLILMDIQMPGMNGYDATRQIREFNTDVIIIAQTAFALSGDKSKAIAAGCNDYISKPIDRNKLKELIQKYFG
ncbi:MAG TPA: hypothetical protein DER09_09590 [Prolixibacteraceae bacterium]|nr:hypothetical protein [Prolixibacteraceae bacterium]